MKKIILLSLMGLFLLGSQSFAQIQFGAKAGLNIANVAISPSGGTSPKSVMGFKVGAFGDMMLGNSLAVGAGLFISTKGAKSEYSYTTFDPNTFTMVTVSTTSTVSVTYLEIPVTAKYYLNLGPAKLYGAAGPYLGMAMGGKVKTDGESTKLKFGSSDTDDMKGMDLGLTLGAGVEINKLIIGLNYDLGLANLIPKPVGSETEKNRVFGISVGYILGKI
jgi:hypothetical protein